ncbi:hypothetical protein PPERSA_04009 [Pseudocohnilembus persalinus]|uniref:Uncharacterized protein n=1 Tax=Pseudocohnilembus persalinus TaxID=266149 RepID=A0A0V0QKS3_PSEPJ|nr:hypothetical protein PPERSA_04009 [Pseudocohnilembus persalinus]|eukprot:KRX02806.1 hypothetical protein PPERSA_04009 [Pseudocohnilembus persalinus]
MSPEDYLYNQRECSQMTKPRLITLQPLDGCNHGGDTTSDEVQVIGVPTGKTVEKFDDYTTFSSQLEQTHPDLIFAQVNPAPFIARQRFLAHKCALQEVEDYSIHGVQNIDPLKIDSWEECVVNRVVLDMLNNNKVHTDFHYADGLATYSYPYIQEKETQLANYEKFIDTIREHVIYNKFSDYNMINQVLHTSLMGKQNVMLGEMPDQLLRLILGNSVEIEEMRDLFKFVVKKNQELKQPLSIKEATLQFLPHIFQMPKDLYITALLKESFQAATQINAYVGIHHLTPIQRYWQGPPNGINFSEATRIPERIRGEGDEILIEKQAIMDVMLESRVWGEKYITNPFPYLEEDITKITKVDFKTMKGCFFQNYKKYNAFKEQMYASLPNYRPKEQPEKLKISQRQ